MGIGLVHPIVVRPTKEMTHDQERLTTRSSDVLSISRHSEGKDFMKGVLFLALALSAVQGISPLHAETPTGTLVGRILYVGPAIPDQVFEVTRDSGFCGAQATIRTVTIHPKTRGLEGAVVSIDGVAVPLSDPAAPALVLTNTRCAFTPRLATGVVGQQVEIRNDDPVMHNTHISMGSRTLVNVAMIPASRPVWKPLKQSGIYTVKCDAHKFMQAHILAFTHPFFSITDETGAFRIPSLPPGEHQVTIWHDTLGTVHQSVTIAATGDTHVTLEYPNHADARKQ